METYPILLGTAGHIDHGKTSLVRALTGIDTDRLEHSRRTVRMTAVVPQLVAVVAVAMMISCGACSSSGSQADDAGTDDGGTGPTDWDGGPLFPRCIAEWPEAPAFSFKPSLEGAELDILWTKSFDTDHHAYGMVLAGERLAFTAGRSIYILDLAGNLVAQTGTAELDLIYSGPSADVDGNFYFSGVRAYSVDKDGQSRWSHPYGENLSNRFEGTWAKSFVISPDGVAYTASTDGFLYAFDTEDGSLLWKRDVGLSDGSYPAWVGTGVGDSLFSGNHQATHLYDKDTGEPWATLPTLDGKRLSLGKVGYSGLVSATRHEDHPEETQRSYFMLDKCGNMQWSLESGRDWYPSVFLPDDSIMVSERDVSLPETPVYANVFSSNGERLLGPRTERVPMLLGADGVGYRTLCQDGESQLIATNSQLEEVGRLSLSGACWNQLFVLSDAGVLYVSRYDILEGRTDVLAVQTSSPGLADTSWPAPRHDNRGSRWLAPIGPAQ